MSLPSSASCASRRRWTSSLLVVPLVLALSAPVATAQASVGSSGSGTAEAATGPAQVQPAHALHARAQLKAGRYTPKTGVKTNDPRSPNRRRIIAHIRKSIDSVRAGQLIRIMSWNVASRGFVGDLLAANKRGVSVRLLMSKGKADAQPKSGDFWRLRRGLRHKSTTHPQRKGMGSWARSCDRSCRGKRGIAHTKSFVFSKVGRAKYVVMSTSANATEVSANSQWNDIYTLTENKKIYDGFIKVFDQAAKDKPTKPGYRTFTGRHLQAYVYPWSGKRARGDRVMNELNRIKCKGVRGGTGVNGRTRIRIAQDAIIGDRGIMISKKLRQLYQAGCNIKIVYALMGNRVLQVVRHTSRGAIPIQQIVSDFDADGVYDRYLHAKVMTVSGYYKNDRSARVAWQGSENWSGLAKISDEQGFKIWRGGAEKVYVGWIEYLFNNPPPPPPPSRLAAARAAGVDPYKIIKENLG